MNNFKWITRRFRKLPEEHKKAVISELKVSSSPGFDFYIFVVLSSIISTFGLITDSPAVIIGAMLVAPLMSPIIGIGMASITGDGRLLRNAGSALLRGALLAVLLAGLLTLINSYLPFISLQELPKEVMVRVKPTPIDLLIAIAGGMAAAYALSQPHLSAALPGVAIATALMPPLGTVGIGLASGHMDVAIGGGLLFITNAVSIAFAAALVFFLLGFGFSIGSSNRLLPISLLLSALLTGLLLFPLTFLSIQLFQEASQTRLINELVDSEVSKINNSELISLKSTWVDDTLDLAITVRTSSNWRLEQVVALQEALVAGLEQPVSLGVNQVLAEHLDPLMPPTSTPTLSPTVTQTIGPSPTITASPTVNPTRTSTLTATPTSTFTLTPSLTPTAAQARVLISYPPSLRLYQFPGGPEIASLRKGQGLTILYRSELLRGILWVEVLDEEGRLGWVPEIYLVTTTPEVKTSTVSGGPNE
jgi:uncharacterized hydrophobic protein (TIGR00271 family)